MGIPAGLVDIGDAADLANIGTLFAFVLVSLGVIFLRRRQPDRKRAFRVPFVPWFPDHLRDSVRRVDVRAYADYLAALCNLVGAGAIDLRFLQPPSQ